MHYEDRDTAEIRLLRAINDLNLRIGYTPAEEDRIKIRASIETLRSELLRLIESLPILSEDELLRMRAGTGHGPAGLMIRGSS